MVGDKVEEAKWKGLDVNKHWQQMKCIMMYNDDYLNDSYSTFAYI